MSERKTAEIKLRVTPSFKAAVQLAAETVGETMSVYMEKATQDRIAAESATASPDAFSPALTTKFDWTNFPQPKSDDAWRFARQFSTNLNPVAPVAPNGMSEECADAASCLHVPCSCDQKPVPAKSAEGACEKNCFPWQWCECKAGK